MVVQSKGVINGAREIEKPQAFQTVKVETGDPVQIAFDMSQASVSRDGDDLVVQFADGATLIFEGAASGISEGMSGQGFGGDALQLAADPAEPGALAPASAAARLQDNQTAAREVEPGSKEPLNITPEELQEILNTAPAAGAPAASEGDDQQQQPSGGGTFNAPGLHDLTGLESLDLLNGESFPPGSLPETPQTPVFAFRSNQPEDAPTLDTPPADTPPADTPPADTPPVTIPPVTTPPVTTPPEDTPPVDVNPEDVPPEDVPPEDVPPEDTPPATDVKPGSEGWEGPGNGNGNAGNPGNGGGNVNGGGTGSGNQGSPSGQDGNQSQGWGNQGEEEPDLSEALITLETSGEVLEGFDIGAPSEGGDVLDLSQVLDQRGPQSLSYELIDEGDGSYDIAVLVELGRGANAETETLAILDGATLTDGGNPVSLGADFDAADALADNVVLTTAAGG